MMGRMWLRARRVALVLCLVGGVAVADARGAPPPLWGGLDPGPYAVGFKRLDTRDASRAPLDGGREPGRRVRVDVWYPARPSHATPMRYGGYVDMVGRDRFVEHAAELGGDATELRERLPELLALETAAVEAAAPARGRFPLVVFPAYGTPAMQSLIAEYLASHGFVVASPPLQGTFEEEFTTGLADLETAVADARHALGVVCADPAVDASRVAVMGVGICASVGLALATRDPRVDAIVSLDGGIPTSFEDRMLKRTPYFDVAAVRVPLLAIHAPHPSVDVAILDQYRYSTRTLVHFPKMSEFHFLNFGMLERFAPNIIGKPPGDTKAGFEAACRSVLRFLGGHATLDADGRWAGLMTVRVVEGLPAPPTLVDLKAIFRARGAAGVVAEFRRLRQADPAPFSPQLFADLGSWLGRGHDPDWSARREIAALRVASFPESARAHFSLAQVLVQANAPDMALPHYREALRLLPNDPDPALDADLRRRIEQVANERLASEK
jgi:hypothetical protein